MSRNRVCFVVSGIVSLVLAAALMPLVGCQTVKGVGKDVQNVGEAGERAIDGK